MPFPLWATLTPLLAALLLWWLTGSPLVLAFAALGPIVALAQRLDTRRSRRRQSAAESEQERQQREALGLQEQFERAEQVERAWGSVATARQIVDGRAELLRGRERPIVLGVSEGLPVSVEPKIQLGIVGPQLLRAAARRAVEVQLQHARIGAQGVVGTLPTPHEADTLAALPVPCEWVLELQHSHAATLWNGLDAQPMVPHLLGRYEADEWVQRVMPAHPGEQPAAQPLLVSIGADENGAPVWLDLAAAPHALVAGTTGSGKTELLRAWLAALCGRHAPSELALILVDYKGGSGFGDLAALPQVAALLTDLDDADVERSFHALAVELTRRERLLAELGVRSFAEFAELADGAALAGGSTPSVPRLVIVIDEYQVLVERTPAVQPVLADIAARGRAFGVHLVLCTQHPGHVVRDELSANCGLRVCLRVLSSAESQALIGGPEAATLAQAGSVAMRSAAGLQRWQVTPLADDELNRLTPHWLGQPRAEAPWLPLLPQPLTERQLNQLDVGSVAEMQLLLCDDVQARRYRSPEVTEFSRLRVIGPAGSGRSTTLQRLAECFSAAGSAVDWCVGSAADRWHTLQRCARQEQPVTLLIDDLDDALSAFDPDYRHGWLELLRELLRDRRHRVAWSSRGSTVLDEFIPAELGLHPDGQGRARWNGLTAQVVFPSTAQIIAGTPAPCWRPDQRTLVVTRSAAQLTALAERAQAEVVLLEARTPEQRIQAAQTLCESVGEYRQLLAADLDTWLSLGLDQSAVLNRSSVLLLDGRLSEVRALTRSSQLPPLLGGGEAWLLEHGAAPERVNWREPAPNSGAAIK